MPTLPASRTVHRELPPARRIVLRDLMRVESRNTIEDGFTTNDHVIDIRIKRVF